MKPESSVPNNSIIKKTWNKPELIFISSNQIAVKHLPSVHEGTGHVEVHDGSNFFLTPANHQGFRLTTSLGSKTHFQSSAAS